MPKDIQGIIIKKYLDQLTFVKLFNLTRDEGNVEKKTKEIMYIPSLKRVSKVWRNEIKSYFAKEWKRRKSENVKEDMRRIISGNISFFVYDTFWKITRGCILKKYGDYFFIRYLSVVLGNHSKINYACDVTLSFDKIKNCFLLHCGTSKCSKMAHVVVKDNLLQFGPDFDIIYNSCDHHKEKSDPMCNLCYLLHANKSVLKIISPVPFNDLEASFPDKVVEYKDIDWGNYNGKTAYFLSVREDLKLLKNYFLENAIEI